MRGVILAMLCATSLAHAETTVDSSAVTAQGTAASIETTAEKVQAAHADEHVAPAGSDPWLASSSASLFARPTLFDAFKLSNDTTTDKKSTYSVSGSYRALAADGSKFLDGLSGSAAYNVTDKIASLGLKWTIDLRDVRWMSADAVALIAAAGEAAFATCKAEHPGVSALELEKQCFPKLAETQLHEIERRYGDLTSWRPSFALAASTGYDFNNGQRDKSTISLSAELSGLLGGTTAAVTANADLDQLPPSMMVTAYRTQIGGGLQASDKFTIAGRWPVTLAAGGKLLSCVGNACTGDESSLELGASIGVQIQKATQVGFNIKWAGSGAHLDDAIAGLALSYTLAR